MIFDQPKSGILIMTNSSNGEGIFKETLETSLRNTFTPIKWEGYTPYNELPPRQPLPVHHEVSVDAKLLDRLTGRYALSPQLVLTVKSVAGHLTLQENEEQPPAVYPESNLQFFSKTSDDLITFDLNAQGKVTGLVIHTGGHSIPVKRLGWCGGRNFFSPPTSFPSSSNFGLHPRRMLYL